MMKTEAFVPISDRYLMLATILSAKRFARERRQSIDWCANNRSKLNAKDLVALDLLQDFELELHPNSRAFIIYCCYADIPAGRTYSAIFDRTNVEIGTETIAKLRFGIFWQRLPTQSLEDGHHQLAVFDFPQGIPAIVETLPIDLNDGGMSPARLGMCDVKVWDSICKQSNTKTPNLAN
jgi:hypothetical protein